MGNEQIPTEEHHPLTVLLFMAMIAVGIVVTIVYASSDGRLVQRSRDNLDACLRDLVMYGETNGRYTGLDQLREIIAAVEKPARLNPITRGRLEIVSTNHQILKVGDTDAYPSALLPGNLGYWVAPDGRMCSLVAYNKDSRVIARVDAPLIHHGLAWPPVKLTVP